MCVCLCVLGVVRVRLRVRAYQKSVSLNFIILLFWIETGWDWCGVVTCNTNDSKQGKEEKEEKGKHAVGWGRKCPTALLVFRMTTYVGYAVEEDALAMFNRVNAAYDGSGRITMPELRAHCTENCVDWNSLVSRGVVALHPHAAHMLSLKAPPVSRVLTNIHTYTHSHAHTLPPPASPLQTHKQLRRLTP